MSGPRGSIKPARRKTTLLFSIACDLVIIWAFPWKMDLIMWSLETPHQLQHALSWKQSIQLVAEWKRLIEHRFFILRRKHVTFSRNSDAMKIYFKKQPFIWLWIISIHVMTSQSCFCKNSVMCLWAFISQMWVKQLWEFQMENSANESAFHQVQGVHEVSRWREPLLTDSQMA